MGCATATCAAPSRTSATASTPAQETVLFLHGSAANGDGWRRTVAPLALLYRCLTPDLIGYGTSMPWQSDVPLTLDAERLALVPLIACCADRFHLVGYSYGGVVALDFALTYPNRVLTLTLIEPVCFNVLREAANETAFAEFVRLRNRFTAALAEGPMESAMRPFLDFWAGEGAWAKLPSIVRADMLGCAGKVLLDWEVAFSFAPARESLASLGSRTLLLRGDQSPRAMVTLVDTLHEWMPGSAHQVIAGANHLLPVTRAADVTQAILLHLHADAERRLS